MGGGIRRFRNHSVAGTVRWPITLDSILQSTAAAAAAAVAPLGDMRLSVIDYVMSLEVYNIIS